MHRQHIPSAKKARDHEPIDHREQMGLLLEFLGFAVVLQDEDDLARQALVKRLPVPFLARLEDPLDGVARALLLAERDGDELVLHAVAVRHRAHEGRCHLDRSAQELEWGRLGECVQPEERARHDARRTLPLAVLHDGVGEVSQQRVLFRWQVEDYRLIWAADGQGKGRRRCWCGDFHGKRTDIVVDGVELLGDIVEGDIWQGRYGSCEGDNRPAHCVSEW